MIPISSSGSSNSRATLHRSNSQQHGTNNSCSSESKLGKPEGTPGLPEPVKIDISKIQSGETILNMPEEKTKETKKPCSGFPFRKAFVGLLGVSAAASAAGYYMQSQQSSSTGVVPYPNGANNNGATGSNTQGVSSGSEPMTAADFTAPPTTQTAADFAQGVDWLNTAATLPKRGIKKRVLHEAPEETTTKGWRETATETASKVYDWATRSKTTGKPDTLLGEHPNPFKPSGRPRVARDVGAARVASTDFSATEGCFELSGKALVLNDKHIKDNLNIKSNCVEHKVITFKKCDNPDRGSYLVEAGKTLTITDFDVACLQQKQAAEKSLAGVVSTHDCMQRDTIFTVHNQAGWHSNTQLSYVRADGTPMGKQSGSLTAGYDWDAFIPKGAFKVQVTNYKHSWGWHVVDRVFQEDFSSKFGHTDYNNMDVYSQKCWGTAFWSVCGWGRPYIPSAAGVRYTDNPWQCLKTDVTQGWTHDRTHIMLNNPDCTGDIVVTVKDGLQAEHKTTVQRGQFKTENYANLAEMTSGAFARDDRDRRPGDCDYTPHVFGEYYMGFLPENMLSDRKCK